MSKHQVSELIVISPLIRFSHLLFYARTLEGKSDTGGCGETAGGEGGDRPGGRREKKRCTPHLSSSKTSTLLIKPGFCREGPQHTDPPYLKHEQPTQTAHWQLYLNRFTKRTPTLVPEIKHQQRRRQLEVKKANAA